MLHVDRHRLGPTVARARLRVLIDHRAHHGSGRLLQAMDLEPETFPTERASSFVNVQPTYVGHSRAAPRSPSRSLPLKQLAWVEVREEVHEEVSDRAADVAQHLCLQPTSPWATVVVAQSQRGRANRDRGREQSPETDRLTYARPVDVDDVMLVLTGALALSIGIRIVVSPRKSLESNYAGDRRWTRIFTFGKADPRPRPITDRALRFWAATGVPLILIGVATLFFGLRAILR
jgi:hypothetical protein